jgi:hypothetical protein
VIEWKLAPGRYIVDLRLLPSAADPARRSLALFANGKRLPVSQAEAGRVSARVEVPSSGLVRLGWTCLGRRSRSDGRSLGLPVTGIAWTKDGPAAA